MSSRDPGAPVAIGFGACFLLAGTALVLAELGLLTLRWTYVLPVVVVTVGLGVLVSGLVQAHRSRHDDLMEGRGTGGALRSTTDR